MLNESSKLVMKTYRDGKVVKQTPIDINKLQFDRKSAGILLNKFLLMLYKSKKPSAEIFIDKNKSLSIVNESLVEGKVADVIKKFLNKLVYDFDPKYKNFKIVVRKYKGNKIASEKQLKGTKIYNDVYDAWMDMKQKAIQMNDGIPDDALNWNEIPIAKDTYLTLVPA